MFVYPCIVSENPKSHLTTAHWSLCTDSCLPVRSYTTRVTDYTTESWFKTLFSGTVGIKGPPAVWSILASERKRVLWVVLCLLIHMGVFVNVNWPAYRPAKWNTASRTHCALFATEWIQMVLFLRHWKSHWQPWQTWQGSLTCDFAPTCGALVRGYSSACWLQVVERNHQPEHPLLH